MKPVVRTCAVARILVPAPGTPVLAICRPPEGRAERRGQCQPTDLGTSRRRGSPENKTASRQNRRRPARGVLGLLRTTPGGLTVSGWAPEARPLRLAAYPPLAEPDGACIAASPALLTAPGAAVSGSQVVRGMAHRDRAAWAAALGMYVLASLARPPLPASRVVTLRSAPSIEAGWRRRITKESGENMTIFLAQFS